MEIKSREMIKILFAFLLLYVSSSRANSAWPEGQYCLPMPVNQICPVAWQKGYRLHHTEQDRTEGQSNDRSGHIPYVFKFERSLGWGFCCKSKIRYSFEAPSWPKGRYCIFRKGGYCPRGFNEGTIYWDDEDKSNNNSALGTLPDGVYGKNTQIYFCCRNDGSRPLSGLPGCISLILMKYNNSCPTVTKYLGPYIGHLDWNTEDDWNSDQRLYAYPDGVSKFRSGTRIAFCTYRSSYSC